MNDLPRKMKRYLTRNRRYMFQIEQTLKLLSAMNFLRFVKVNVSYKQHSIVYVFRRLRYMNTIKKPAQQMDYELSSLKDVRLIWSHIAELALNDQRFLSSGIKRQGKAKQKQKSSECILAEAYEAVDPECIKEPCETFGDRKGPLGLHRDLFIFHRLNWGVSHQTQLASKWFRTQHGSVIAPLSSSVIRTYRPHSSSSTVQYFRLEFAVQNAFEPLFSEVYTEPQIKSDYGLSAVIERNRKRRAANKRRLRMLMRRKHVALSCVMRKKGLFIFTDTNTGVTRTLKLPVKRRARMDAFSEEELRLSLGQHKLLYRRHAQIRMRLQMEHVKKDGDRLHVQMQSRESFRRYQDRIQNCSKFSPCATAQVCKDFCENFRDDLQAYIKSKKPLSSNQVSALDVLGMTKEYLEKTFYFHRKRPKREFVRPGIPMDSRHIHFYVVETTVKSLLCIPPRMRPKNLALAANHALPRFDINKILPEVVTKLSHDLRFVSGAKRQEQAEYGNSVNIAGKFYKLSCRFDLHFCSRRLSANSVRHKLGMMERKVVFGEMNAKAAVQITRALALGLEIKSVEEDIVGQVDGDCDAASDDDNVPRRRVSGRKRQLKSFVGMDESDDSGDDNNRKRYRVHDEDFVPNSQRTGRSRGRPRKSVAVVCDKISALLSKANRNNVKRGRPKVLRNFSAATEWLQRKEKLTTHSVDIFLQRLLSNTRDAEREEFAGDNDHSRSIISYAITEHDGRLVKYRPVRYKPFRKNEIILKTLRGKFECFRHIDFGDEYLRLLVAKNNFVIETPFETDESKMSESEKLNWDVRLELESILLKISSTPEFVSLQSANRSIRSEDKSLNEELSKMVDALLTDKIDCSTFVDFVVQSKFRFMGNLNTDAEYRQFNCVICKQTFLNSLSLKKHMRNSHSEFISEPTDANRTLDYLRRREKTYPSIPDDEDGEFPREYRTRGQEFILPKFQIKNHSELRNISHLMISRSLSCIVRRNDENWKEEKVLNLDDEHRFLYDSIDRAGSTGLPTDSRLLKDLRLDELVYEVGIDMPVFVSFRNILDWCNPVFEGSISNPAGNMIDISRKELSCPVIYNQYYIAKPWLQLDGQICMPVVRMFLEAIMLFIQCHPGVTTEVIHLQLTGPFLSLIETSDLLNCLKRLNCLATRSVNHKCFHPVFENYMNSGRAYWFIAMEGIDIFAVVFDDDSLEDYSCMSSSHVSEVRGGGFKSGQAISRLNAFLSHKVVM
ncbi:hypothetical protein ACOME3_004385 [Neoechinorhynchus agilis]